MTKISCIVIFLCVIIVALICGVGVLCHVYPIKYKKIIDKYCREYNIEESLIFAIIKVESNFVECAHSPKGAVGLMQILPTTAKWIENSVDVSMLRYAATNIKVGTKYVRYLLDKYNNSLISMLAAYNAGEGNVDRWLTRKYKGNFIDSRSNLENMHNILMIEDIEYRETKDYVLKVLKCVDYYKFIYNLE